MLETGLGGLGGLFLDVFRCCVRTFVGETKACLKLLKQEASHPIKLTMHYFGRGGCRVYVKKSQRGFFAITRHHEAG